MAKPIWQEWRNGAMILLAIAMHVSLYFNLLPQY
jgi:hypothetical protein